MAPVFTIAEYAQASGRDLITNVVLAYEIYQRFADVFWNPGFDNTNFACLGTAIAAGKLLRFTPEQLSHCISMAVVPNVILKQARVGHLTMFYTAPSGHAGRAGVFAAMLARAGMEGPHMPFEGKAGWCDNVARKRFSLDTLGGKDTPFKIMDTQIKSRPSTATAMSCILAAEKVAPIKNINDIIKVIVAVHKYAKDREGKYGDVGELNPDSRVTAYYSIPYLVAVTLMDGTVTLRSYNDAHLWNPELRAFLKKIEVVEDGEFTKAYYGTPQLHRMRVTVITNSGEQLVGEAGGGDKDDLTSPKSDEQIEKKFRGLTEDVLGANLANLILERLWHLEDLKNVAEIPPLLVLA